MLLFTAALSLLLTACAAIPKGVTPVTGFEPDRYLGKWYEIARLDHSFERGMTHVTAEYSRREDGRIDVLNRGYDTKKSEWSTADGVARFRGDESVASLSVTFQWPFSGGYNVMFLDKEEYQWAVVSGPSRKYMWILARTPELPEPLLNELVEKARALDFPVDDLIYVKQVPPIAEGQAD
jgi:apolipoprotein D and lipocalin family protein